jgi:hypothetical protein
MEDLSVALPDLSRFELECLRRLWARGEGSVRDLHRELLRRLGQFRALTSAAPLKRADWHRGERGARVGVTSIAPVLHS